MKLYAAKSSAHRAAKAAGLEQYEIVEVNGQFGYQMISPVATTEAEEPVVGEYVNCPRCGIHLSNGYGVHGLEVNGHVVRHGAFEYECLSCGKEFGPAIKGSRKVAVSSHSVIGRPTKTVWHIADEMSAANPQVRRKDVIAECVRRGIAFFTARTQYQKWKQNQAA
ncbi:MAG TPA: hypothetical protein VFV18_07340 [Porticoccaceae bacterium]|nr:hypothetical protein [Porticoccaceae bacterium]